ncbi:MAG: hypothetical protein ACI9NY_000618 [Kiritimatiellia bacterium]|jgi:hypothetical protein
MQNEEPNKPHFWQVVLSTMSAAFGVQSRHNRERDFQHGSIYTYIAAGVIFTLAFIVCVTLLVKMVLRSNGL